MDNIEIRLWRRVNKGGPIVREELGECWVWTGYRDRMGYGQIGRSQPRRLEYVHRVSWELANGSAGDLCVLHRCDNPACVRPEHLFLGTRTDNMADKVAKGRQHRGTSHPKAILNENIVREIRSRRAGGARAIDISRELGVSYALVRNVANGYLWKHVR